MKWYEYVWMALPILLMFIGGGLGGALGIIATYINAGIFRSDRSEIAKYIFTAIISVLTTIVFLAIATVIQLAIEGN